MEIIDTIKAAKFGDSIYARIPARVAKLMDISKGTVLQVGKEGNNIVFTKKGDDRNYIQRK